MTSWLESLALCWAALAVAERIQPRAVNNTADLGTEIIDVVLMPALQVLSKCQDSVQCDRLLSSSNHIALLYLIDSGASHTESEMRSRMMSAKSIPDKTRKRKIPVSPDRCHKRERIAGYAVPASGES